MKIHRVKFYLRFLIIILSHNSYAQLEAKLAQILSFDVGSWHNCAIFDSGKIKCWGDNSFGSLGVLDDVNRGDLPESMTNLPFVALSEEDHAIQVTAGGAHTCTLLSDHTLKCWGTNDNGQLGHCNDFPRGIHPKSMGKNLPKTDLGSNFNPVFIGAGMAHTCALSDQGEVKCWGGNDFGQLGLEDILTRGYFRNTMGDNLSVLNFGSDKLGKKLKVKKLAVGYTHNCVILENDGVKCWGRNIANELGVAGNFGGEKNTMGDALPYLKFNNNKLGAYKIREISAGFSQTCAIVDFDNQSSGKIICWGENSCGLSGRDNNEKSYTFENTLPIEFSDDVSALKVVTGIYINCALFSNGKVRCWGRNDDGRLGVGNIEDQGDNPNEMKNISYVNLGEDVAIDIRTKGSHTCALLNNNRMKCWGANINGVLGLEEIGQNRGSKPEDMGLNLPYVKLQLSP